MYLAALGREFARHQCKERRLARAVLAHHRHLHPAAHEEIYLVEDRFIVPVFEGNLLKAYNALFAIHRITLPYSYRFSKLNFFSRGQLLISASRFEAEDLFGCSSVWTILRTHLALV